MAQRDAVEYIALHRAHARLGPSRPRHAARQSGVRFDARQQQSVRTVRSLVRIAAVASDLSMRMIGVATIALMFASASWLAANAPAITVNPYARQPEAISAGAKLFRYHCAACHQPDAKGKQVGPDLRAARVQRTPDGALFWF